MQELKEIRKKLVLVTNNQHMRVEINSAHGDGINLLF